MAEPADFADSCAAPRTRPLSADEVLGILRRGQRFAEIGEADADELPTHDMTIRRWSQSFDEGGPQGYVRWIFELEEGQEWKRLFAWGTSGTVGDVCRYIAARASIEDLESARVLGVADRKAGAFLLLRRKLAEAGCDVSRLRPSTPLAACPYRSFSALRAAVLRVAPELVPPLCAVAPQYGAAICSIVLAGLSFILGMALLVAPWSVAPCFVLSLLALFGAVRAAITGHLTRLPELVTFRDLCAAMARELLPAGGLKCDCGYPLFGLPERRCPECGRAFSAEQFCLTEAALERAMRDCGAPAAGPRTDCKT